jgi:hypothetical protein
MLESLGMVPFQVYSCDIEPKDLKSMKFRRASELFGNLTADTLQLSLSNNKGQKIIDMMTVPPYSFFSPVTSGYFGIDGDNNHLVTLLDKDGNCVRKYGALENGYLIIRSDD